MEKRFEQYLIEQGYKKTTPSGYPSTVYAYIKSINNVCAWENITMSDLVNKINSIVCDYDIGGIKEEYGLKSHSTVINSLKAFERFVEHFKLSVSKDELTDIHISSETTDRLIEVINIPKKYMRKTLMADNMYYDVLELYQDRVVGCMNKKENKVFHFSNYDTIAFNSNKKSIFSEIIFYGNLKWAKTQAQQRYRAVREPSKATIHTIRFFGGLFKSSQTDLFAKNIAEKIMNAYDEYMINKGL